MTEKSVKYLTTPAHSPLGLLVYIVIGEVARNMGASLGRETIWEEPQAVVWTLVTRRFRYELRWHRDRSELMARPRRGGNLSLIARTSNDLPLRLLRIIVPREKWA